LSVGAVCDAIVRIYVSGHGLPWWQPWHSRAEQL